MQRLDEVGAKCIGWATRSAENFYLNLTSPVKNLFFRVLDVIASGTETVISSAFAIVIGAPLLAYSLRKSFYQFKGIISENSDVGKTIKVASWNINGIPFNQVGDKTAPFYSRVAGIIQLLRGHDVIMLQEAFGDSAYMILKGVELFNKAFGRSGIQLLGLDSGQLCLTTLKVVNFQFQKFDQGSNAIARGFSVLETESTIFIQTHLISGKENGMTRVAQMAQIKTFISTQTKPCMVMGDMNIGENRAVELKQMVLEDFDVQGGLETCWDAGKQRIGHDLIMLQKDRFHVKRYEELGVLPPNSEHNSDHILLSMTVKQQIRSRL